jgi:putative phosphoribosyl transferase
MKHAPIMIPAGTVTLLGDLTLPGTTEGLVLFAHGSGSSRHSPRNRYVADVLNQHSLGTLLVDLLTPEEGREDEVTAQFRFDIDRLAERLIKIAKWLHQTPPGSGQPLGLFGASTGAAAALLAAARLPDLVKAVVSRGGRPDLAGERTSQVSAATLLIVGSRDREVLQMNRDAMEWMRCEKKLAIVPGATHLFEEPGTLTQVATLAADWFTVHLQPSLPTTER